MFPIYLFILLFIQYIHIFFKNEVKDDVFHGTGIQCEWLCTQSVLNVTNILQWPFNICLNSLLLTKEVGLLVVWMISILTYPAVVSIVNQLSWQGYKQPLQWLSQKFFQLRFIDPFKFFPCSSIINLLITWSCVNAEFATSYSWVKQPRVIKGTQKKYPHFYRKGKRCY